MIEANGAELWAISVSNPLQPLECSPQAVSDFFVEVSRRIRKGFGEAIVPVCRDFDGALGKPFLRRVFTRCPPQWCACWLQAGGAPQADHRPASGRPPDPPPRPTPPEV